MNKIATRLLSVSLAGVMLLGLVPAAYAGDDSGAGAGTPSPVVADWKLGKDSVRSGSIADGNLVMSDSSGNGNDLKMQLYQGKNLTSDAAAGKWDDYLSFSDASMTGKGGSLDFHGDSVNGAGASLVTVDGAPINSDTFDNATPSNSCTDSPRTGPGPTDGWGSWRARRRSQLHVPRDLHGRAPDSR
jgi:hypothetical protein